MNNEVDFELLETAIVSDITAQFPDLKTVEFYREDRKSLQTPAVVLEMTEWEYHEEADPMTGKLAVMAQFDAEIIIGFRSVEGRKAKSEVRKLSSALGAWIYQRRWVDPRNPDKKIPTGEAVLIGAYPDDLVGFNDNDKGRRLDNFEVWRLSWRQIVFLGSDIWQNDGSIPTDVYFSVTPEVGVPHKDDYVNVLP